MADQVREPMRRKVSAYQPFIQFVLLFFSLVVLLTIPLQAQDQFLSEQVLTWKGKVVAEYCVLREGSLGADWKHREAAKLCVRRGSPVAIQTSTQLYRLTTDKKGLQKKSSEFLGRQVRIEGFLLHENNRRLIRVVAIKKA